MTDTDYIPFEKLSKGYKPARELFYSVDIEADGPIPGPYSMLSLGCAVFDDKGPYNGLTYSVNLETLTEAKPVAPDQFSADTDTNDFWKRNPEAWAACRTDLKHPVFAMSDFNAWVKGISRKTGTRPVFVAYPAGFDFMFVYWYFIRFVGSSPFSFSALDMKSYAMAKLGCPYRASAKRNFPKEWFTQETIGHNHIALDDAIEQGHLFINMLKHPLVGPRPAYKLGKI